MSNSELLRTSAETLGQAKEVLSIQGVENLLYTLRDLGHPYGLLMPQPPIKDKLNQASVSSVDVKKIFSAKIATPGAKVKGWLSLALVGHSFSGSKDGDVDTSLTSFSEESSGGVSGSSVDWGLPGWTESLGPASLVLFSLGATSGKEKVDVAEPLIDPLPLYEWLTDIKMEKLDWKALEKSPVKDESKKGIQPGAGLLSVAVVNKESSENSLEEKQKTLEIGKSKLSFGSASLVLKDYKGEEPFVIKTQEGEEVGLVNPGDSLGSIHLSGQAAHLRDFSPLKKIEIMINDLKTLLTRIDESRPDLAEKKQATLEKARGATIIGISHLVRLFRRKTGLPTWKLDILPPLIQKFHQRDSQAVSVVFGGKRKVKTDDVEMLVITPEMRRVLVAG